MVCLHCGYDAHPDADCEQNMRWMVKDKATAQEVKETVKWTLANSRRCPNCSIMINRDEGCNKVDCSYCGFCFCWACRSSWADVSVDGYRARDRSDSCVGYRAVDSIDAPMCQIKCLCLQPLQPPPPLQQTMKTRPNLASPT